LNNTEAKIKELQKFLRRRNIKYVRIEEGSQSRLYFDDTTYVSTRSGYYDKYATMGIDEFSLRMISKYLLEISSAFVFEKESNVYEKTKLNILLEKIDKTIKNRHLNVKFLPHNSFGGHTDSRTQIVIYDPQDEPISEYLKIVPGINYHEMGHVLFTCSFESLAKDIRLKYPQYDSSYLKLSEKKRESCIKSVLQTINALEDGRMENLMGNKYGGAIPYFKSTIFNFLLASIEERVDMGEKITEFDCALIAGRKYIPHKFRKWVFDKYIDCDEEHTYEKAKRVNSYINKFIVLSWKKDRQEMIELGMGFFFEFIKPELDKKQQAWDDSMNQMMRGMGSSMNNISSNSDVDIDEDEEEMLKKVMQDIISEHVEGSNDDNKENKEDSNSKSPQSNSEEEKKEDNTSNTSNESNSRSNEEKTSNNSGGHDEEEDVETKENSESGSDDNSSIRDEIEKSRSELNEYVKNSANNLEKKLKQTRIWVNNNGSYKDRNVTTDMKKDRSLLEKKLKEFVRKCRNGYQPRKRKGGVDIGEARRQEYRGGTRIFRQYKHNVQKALDIDIAFVLDCSFSMSGTKIREASRQLWVSSTACESIGSKVKIFTFSNYDLGTIEQPPNSRTMYREPQANGGTVIGDTMYKAESYLNTSKANTKWFISLTDGEIYDEETHEQLIIRMKNDGITCGKINLSTINESYTSNNDNQLYDYVLNMIVNKKRDKNTLEGENIVTFFKKIYEVSLKRIGIEI